MTLFASIEWSCAVRSHIYIMVVYLCSATTFAECNKLFRGHSLSISSPSPRIRYVLQNDIYSKPNAILAPTPPNATPRAAANMANGTSLFNPPLAFDPMPFTALRNINAGYT